MYPTSIFLLLLWVIFLVSHYFNVYYSSYDVVWWLDILMHTWGGFLVVATMYQVKKLKVFPALLSQWWLQPLIVLFAAMIIWELFELQFGLVTRFNYLADTLYDILCGLSGGLISFLVFGSRTIKK